MQSKVFKNSKLNAKIPVILDTDIGTDIDDTWAIAMMLGCPELDIRMILTSTGNTIYKAKIVAKLMETSGRTYIPIGIGLYTSDAIDGQGEWVKDYNLSQYPGVICDDGISSMNDIIMSSENEITIISIGPATNIALAIEREPEIIKKCRYIGMQGSIRKGYFNSDSISDEYNVRADAASCRKVFEAPWNVTITPVDTCGLIKLEGEKYQKVLNCQKPIIKALMENYRVWENQCFPENKLSRYAKESTVLYDTVAIYLAFSEEMLDIEELVIKVTDDGYTIITKNAPIIRCATGWKDLNGFEKFLVDRLIK